MFRNKLIAIVSLGVVITFTQVSLSQIPKPKTRSKPQSGAAASTGVSPKSSAQTTVVQSPRDQSTGQISAAASDKPKVQANRPGTQTVNAPGYIGETEKNPGAKTGTSPARTHARSGIGAQMNMQGDVKSPGNSTTGSDRQAVPPTAATGPKPNIINTAPKVKPRVNHMEEESSERHAGTTQTGGQKPKHPKKP